MIIQQNGKDILKRINKKHKIGKAFIYLRNLNGNIKRHIGIFD